MTLEERIEKLERSNRRWRVGAALLVLVVGGLGADRAFHEPQDLLAKHIKCESLEVDATTLLSEDGDPVPDAPLPFVVLCRRDGVITAISSEVDSGHARLRLVGPHEQSEVVVEATGSPELVQNVGEATLSVISKQYSPVDPGSEPWKQLVLQRLLHTPRTGANRERPTLEEPEPAKAIEIARATVTAKESAIVQLNP